MSHKWNPRSRSQIVSAMRNRSETHHDTLPAEQPDPIATDQVIPMTARANPGRANAEEFLPSARVETAGGGFVSKPPKGKRNQKVSTLNSHTKQVPAGTKSYRANGKVTASRGPKGSIASVDQMKKNVRHGD